MKIPRCAPAWLMPVAHDLIKAGKANPGSPNLSWIPNWNAALHWIQQPTYCALSYRCDGEMDASMQNQIMDAFARASQKSLVKVAHQTPVSAICFYGGAPANIQLDTFNYDEMQINRPPRD